MVAMSGHTTICKHTMSLNIETNNIQRICGNEEAASKKSQVVKDNTELSDQRDH